MTRTPTTTTTTSKPITTTGTTPRSTSTTTTTLKPASTGTTLKSSTKITTPIKATVLSTLEPTLTNNTSKLTTTTRSKRTTITTTPLTSTSTSHPPTTITRSNPTKTITTSTNITTFEPLGVADCGFPSNVTHGRVSVENGTMYGSVAEYSCEEGYTLDGSYSTECQANGMWQDIDISCIVINCSLPRYLTHGSISVENGTTYRSVAVYSCEEGYMLDGMNSTQCQANGSWQDIDVSCIAIECGLPHNLTHGNVSLNGTTFGSLAVFSCHAGYTLSGSNSTECLANSTWRYIDVRCTPIDCDKPTNIKKGTVEYTLTTFNHSAFYTCDHGYTTANATVINCTPEGLWDDDPPTCTDVDECSGSNECHYSAKCTNLNGSYQCTCNDGYTDSGENRGRQCDDNDECAFVGDYFCRRNRNQTRWCTNTAGSYYCGCNRGWTGTHCEKDVNECDGGTSCGQNADCTNTFGSFYCKCRADYPQGNPFYGCYSPVMLSFKSKAVIDGVRGDNEILPPVNIPGGRFPYFGQYFSLFRPSLNGFLALNYPPLYESYGAENSTLWKKYVENHVVIAPLWTNLDSRNITGAGVWVHVFSNNTGNRSDILKIQEHVQKYSNNSEFNASVAFAVTWKHVTIHSPYMPGYRLYKHQNLSMQAIMATDGLYTYMMFIYDQEQFSIKPLSYTPVAAGYTFPGNFTGKILADRHNFTNLKNESNVNQEVKGRWLHNVTYITDDMWDEVRCRKFHENQTLKEWTREQLKNSYPCPCYEQDMKEDYTFKQNDSIWSNKDEYTHCYESWFFNPYDIKQRCCYRFGELRKEYPFAIGAEYMDTDINAILEAGFRQCCSAVNNQRYCHLYYDVNPPDDCSSWSPDDEGE
ncbi:uncharacterized protein LOC128236769 [Mya arenaria]|uniref:uncharacterized protein LOC128236769 n=1 Tax=Mya arenaria TaxID=6604 RepID=UPI0022E71EF9|nr:uncharacterized protein LOC128236769 [Mya arenaria]